MNRTTFHYPHDQEPDIFLESLAYTEAKTGFPAHLIEKDYYCSITLRYLFLEQTMLVFKGGTCLNKLYAGFYRLSEDLDFIVPMETDAARSERSHNIKPIKALIEQLPEIVPGVKIVENLRGHNASRQYIGYLEYHSGIVDKPEKIKIEIGLREPLLMSAEIQPANTLALNPFSYQPMLPVFPVQSMALMEAYAEKVRAALTRRKPAIRDFYDLMYAVQQLQLNVRDRHLIQMVRKKLEIPGNPPATDISAERQHDLRQQLNGELQPVLRPADFNSFSLDDAILLIKDIAASL